MLRRTALNGARFDGCKLTGADLSESTGFDVTFEETLLVSAKLPGFHFRKSTLRRIDFSNADLRNCDYRLSVFEDCSLRNAGLEGARFEGADVRGADIGGLKLRDAGLFRGAIFSVRQAALILTEFGISVR